MIFCKHKNTDIFIEPYVLTDFTDFNIKDSDKILSEIYRLRTELETFKDLSKNQFLIFSIEDYYVKKIESLQDREERFYKDLKNIKAEVDWLVEKAPLHKCPGGDCSQGHHHGHHGRRHGKNHKDKIIKSDFDDLQNAVTRAQQNFQNY